MKKLRLNLTTKKGLIIFLILFALLYVIIYVVPRVFDVFTSTYIAEYGTLEVKQEAECLFVRTEKVYNAPAGGAVERLVEAGELVRASTPVAAAGGVQVAADVRGIVSYSYDGFESRLTPENVDALDSSIFAEYRESEAQTVEMNASTVENSAPLFKIIDSSKWYLVCWLSEEEASIFAEGRKVSVRFEEDEDDGIPMQVYSVTAQDGEFRVILSCNREYDGLDRYRIKDCEIVVSAYSGIILETDSIAEVDGVKGVYVIDKFGETNFTPVSILSSQGGKTVVQRNFFYDAEGNSVTTVSTYDEILRNAGK